MTEVKIAESNFQEKHNTISFTPVYNQFTFANMQLITNLLNISTECMKMVNQTMSNIVALHMNAFTMA